MQLSRGARGDIGALYAALPVMNLQSRTSRLFNYELIVSTDRVCAAAAAIDAIELKA